MSSTPRTDAAEYDCEPGNPNYGGRAIMVVKADLARQLETELADLKRQVYMSVHVPQLASVPGLRDIWHEGQKLYHEHEVDFDKWGEVYGDVVGRENLTSAQQNNLTELASLRRQVAEAVYRTSTSKQMERAIAALGITPDLIRDSQTDNDTRTGVCRDDTRTGDSPLDRLAKQVDEAGLYDCENGGEG